MVRDNPRELTLTVHHRSDAGRVRDHNEDYLGYRQPEESELRAEAGWLYAVADGVGGARAGEVASKLAVQTLLAAYYHSYQEAPADRLREAFAEANRAVHERASEQEGPHRMGTTLVAVAIRGRELTVTNVGDSRAYLIHEGQIHQITHDHSVVAQLVAQGVITPQQAESHPRRHIISRSIGARPEVEADVFAEAFLPGDRLLLCSDGLTEHVTDDEILAAMQDEDAESSVQRLVDLANERGGTDNTTVLVVRALREREDRLPPLALPPETEEAPLPQRSRRPWIGVIVAIVLACAAGLAAGTFMLLSPTPTPTATATATPLPAVATPTLTATTVPAPMPIPVDSPSAEPTPGTVEVPRTATLEPPTATSLPQATGTAAPRPTAMPSPSDTPIATLSLTATALPMPTDTPLPTTTQTVPPTPTSTSETSLLPTPTNTTQGSPLPTPP
jgi:serine/threonine protein phosphatase PrpC